MFQFSIYARKITKSYFRHNGYFCYFQHWENKFHIRIKINIFYKHYYPSKKRYRKIKSKFLPHVKSPLSSLTFLTYLLHKQRPRAYTKFYLSHNQHNIHEPPLSCNIPYTAYIGSIKEGYAHILQDCKQCHHVLFMAFSPFT